MGKLPWHSTRLHLALDIRIDGFLLRHPLGEWLSFTNSCVWISRKLSRVKPLLLSDGKPRIGINRARKTSVRIGLKGKTSVWVGLNRESRRGIDLSWKAGVRVNRLWNACIKIRLSLLGSVVDYLVGFLLFLLLSSLSAW